MVGVIRQYELTGNKELYDIADFFWHTVVHNHSYVIGGNSEAEHFGVPGRICDRITDKTCENCNTYNMLKLTRHLFCLNPDISKADYYERALYNQTLASQNPEDGMVCYMSPLSAGSQRNYSTHPFDSFWCCVGTGLENHVRYGEFIYHTDEQDNLYVNLFIRLYWIGKRGGYVSNKRQPIRHRTLSVTWSVLPQENRNLPLICVIRDGRKTMSPFLSTGSGKLSVRSPENTSLSPENGKTETELVLSF